MEIGEIYKCDVLWPGQARSTSTKECKNVKSCNKKLNLTDWKNEWTESE